jgi:hypothetical protein
MEPAKYYSEQEVAELLAVHARRESAQVAWALTQGYAGIVKRLHIRWAVVCALVLLVGIGAGIVGERQAVVVPCVRALDGYRDTLTLTERFVGTNASDRAAQNDLFAEAGAIRAGRDAAERRCRGSR